MTVIGRSSRFLGIDRRAFGTIAILAAPLELIALFGAFTCPLDIGCPQGTNPLWLALAGFGIYVFLPVFVLVSSAPFPTAAALFAVPIVVYAELFVLLTLLLMGYRFFAKLLSKLDSPAAQK